MFPEPKKLRRELRDIGIARNAVDAVWPDWWSDDAASSPSALAELSFTVARRLGLSPQSLFDDGSPTFVWHDAASFKGLTVATAAEAAALTSFGVAVGQAAVSGVKESEIINLPSAALDLRQALLSQSSQIRFDDLLSLSWGVGIPVVQPSFHPLQHKRMHAMSVGIRGRSAILIGHQYSFAAKLSFTLAHELGHLALGHVGSTGSATVDLDDPSQDFSRTNDPEEAAANAWALTLLTGQDSPVIETNAKARNGTELAAAVTEAGERFRIDPGTLALCYAFQHDSWAVANSALSKLPPGKQSMARYVNRVATQQIDWASLAPDTSVFLRKVLATTPA